MSSGAALPVEVVILIAVIMAIGPIMLGAAAIIRALDERKHKNDQPSDNSESEKLKEETPPVIDDTKTGHGARSWLVWLRSWFL